LPEVKANCSKEFNNSQNASSSTPPTPKIAVEEIPIATTELLTGSKHIADITTPVEPTNAPKPSVAPIEPFNMSEISSEKTPPQAPAQGEMTRPDFFQAFGYTLNVPNMLPCMDEATGQFPGPIVKCELSQYENGLHFFHSSEHVPSDLDHAATQHQWFSYHNIEVSKIVVGIPWHYFDDCARGHALYITGIRPQASLALVEKVFAKSGKVKYSIAVTDMHSKDTFRWIVMRSFQEAQQVLFDFQGKKFGSQVINVCRAFAPGKAIALLGRSIAQIYQEQHYELCSECTDQNKTYIRAVLEVAKGYRPEVCCMWFNNLRTPTHKCQFHGTTWESEFVGRVDQDSLAATKTNRIWERPKYANNDLWDEVRKQEAANLAALAAASDAASDTGSDTTVVPVNGQSSAADSQQNKGKQKEEATTLGYSHGNVLSDSDESTITPPVALQAIARPITAPSASVAATTSSWADIAAPSANADSDSFPKMIDLHPENKSSSFAPRVQAPVDPSVIAHLQAEKPEDQQRVVIIYNLPSTISLTDVSEAVAEGPVLKIVFGSDVVTRMRWVGVIFQWARDAHAFHDVLQQEREASTPGRFRFIVEAGIGPLYPYDEWLDWMMHRKASRRLTIAKKCFFFQFGKKQFRRFCEKLVGAENIQLIWLYNGGNATVVFSDVQSAVKVKSVMDELAESNALKGDNMVSFENVNVSFSQDPCFKTEKNGMNLVTDIPDLNQD
jgi:hypothetical protein